MVYLVFMLYLQYHAKARGSWLGTYPHANEDFAQLSVGTVLSQASCGLEEIDK